MRGVAVENYERRWTAENGWSGRWEKAKGTLSKRALSRLLREATEALAPFGVDLSLYGPPEVTFSDMTIAAVRWSHRTTGAEIELTDVWMDARTGTILQYGSNYGRLCL